MVYKPQRIFGNGVWMDHLYRNLFIACSILAFFFGTQAHAFGTADAFFPEEMQEIRDTWKSDEPTEVQEIQVSDSEYEAIQNGQVQAGLFFTPDDGFDERLKLIHGTVMITLAEAVAMISVGAGKVKAMGGGSALKVCSVTRGCTMISRTALGVAILLGIYGGSVLGDWFHEYDEKHWDGAFYGTLVDGIFYVQDLIEEYLD